MSPDVWLEWVAWAGLVIPLAVLAWSAWRYTSDRHEESQHRRFERFFSTTDKVGQAESSLISKVAALYELRKFPEYAEVIARMTDRPDVIGRGRAKEVLELEFRLAHEAMVKRQ